MGGSQFENIDLSSVSVSSEGFSNSLTPQIAATSTEALQWMLKNLFMQTLQTPPMLNQEVSTEQHKHGSQHKLISKQSNPKLMLSRLIKQMQMMSICFAEKLSKANFVRPIVKHLRIII